LFPDVSISVVGVQDVAEAHVMAKENKNAMEKDFCCQKKQLNLKI
jgi:hypothetical protein